MIETARGKGLRRYAGRMKCVPGIIYDRGRQLAFDLYLPDDLLATSCVIYAHGGGFQKGSRHGEEVGQFAEPLTDAGFAMAAISYRLGTSAADFSEQEQGYIDAYLMRSKRVGLTLAPKLYGAGFIAAMEDISTLIEYLWVEGDRLGILRRKVGLLGASAGGIAGLAAAYPPIHWEQRTSKPDAVVAISSAIVQPWRLTPDGVPCLLFHGPNDRIIDIRNAELGVRRGQAVGARVKLINTQVPGHASQIDAVLDGADENGVSYLEMALTHFDMLNEPD